MVIDYCYVAIYYYVTMVSITTIIDIDVLIYFCYYNQRI